MHINSHNEAVLHDGESPDLAPGQCACGTMRGECPDCGYVLECDECGAAARCVCDDEATESVPEETMSEMIYGINRTAAQ